MRHSQSIPRLQQGDYLLGALQAGDEQAHRRLYCSEQVMQYLRQPMSQAAASKQFQRELAANQQQPRELITWRIACVKTSQFIGVFYLFWQGRPDDQPEFGLMLTRAFHGQGVGRDITVYMVNYLLAQPGITRLWSKIKPGNRAAVQILNNVGFQQQTTPVSHPLGELAEWASSVKGALSPNTKV